MAQVQPRMLARLSCEVYRTKDAPAACSSRPLSLAVEAEQALPPLTPMKTTTQWEFLSAPAR